MATFRADLHLHSKHAYATSRDLDLEHVALAARRKGLAVVATGDFTHGAWLAELEEKLAPAEPGLFRLRPDIERDVSALDGATGGAPTRFLLEVEISTVHAKLGRTRRVHHLVYMPELDAARRLRERLAPIGNLDADGRPTLRLDPRDLLEIVLETHPAAYLVPAHIWTPWYSALGARSGFDSIEECYGDLAEHIFAVETGLSSDPAMNRRVPMLDRFRLVSNSDAHSPAKLGREACVFEGAMDYFAIRRALETGEGWGGTIEFFAEEGKYHWDGHRRCGVAWSPEESRAADGLCPVCGKPVTMGVLHRLLDLADGDRPGETREDWTSLLALDDVVAQASDSGPRSRRVQRQVDALVARVGPELDILEIAPLEDVERASTPLVAEAIRRVRNREIVCAPGYDGVFGSVRVFPEPGESEPA